MDLLLIMIALVFLTVYIKNKPQLPKEIKVIAKTCPPHSWYWNEIKDGEGNVASYQMVCKVCGPLGGKSEV